MGKNENQKNEPASSAETLVLKNEKEASAQAVQNKKPPILKMNPAGHRFRMRKKLFDRGARIFSDVELLEMILMMAIPRKDVKPLAKRLLSHFITLSQVVHAEPRELKKIKGVGDAVIFQLKVIEGVCYSILRPPATQGTILKEWKQVLDFCRFCVAHEKQECLYLVFLNRRMQLISIDNVQKGTASRLPIVPTDILKRALNLDAVSILIIHNHPSGMAKPSGEDIARTEEIIEILKPSGVSVYDHLIIAKQGIYSFNRRGLVD